MRPTILKGILCLLCGLMMFQEKARGAEWEKLNVPGGNLYQVVIQPGSPNKILALQDHRKILRWNHQTSQWVVSREGQFYYLTADPAQPNVFWVDTDTDLLNHRRRPILGGHSQ